MKFEDRVGEKKEKEILEMLFTSVSSYQCVDSKHQVAKLMLPMLPMAAF